MRDQDLPDAPSTLSELRTVGVWCDDASYSRVERAYHEAIPEGLRNKVPSFVSHLNEIAAEKLCRNWNELVAFSHCSFWAIVSEQISSREASWVPRVGVMFSVDTSLGMVIDEANGMLFVSVSCIRHCGALRMLSPIGEPLDLMYAKMKMERAGWRVKSMRGPRWWEFWKQ